jgi:hypothetical protein
MSLATAAARSPKTGEIRMVSGHTALPTLPNTRKLTIVAQDPSIRMGGRIVTAEVEIPAEGLLPGPCGYRINVIDYDSTNNVLYDAAELESRDGSYLDPFSKERLRAKTAAAFNSALLDDPKFHAQNAYAIAMRILARFEFALGRRSAWGSDGHQLHVAPHAFAEANAFYSKEDRGLFFGYFAGASGRPVYTCLSHDVVAQFAKPRSDRMSSNLGHSNPRSRARR